MSTRTTKLAIRPINHRTFARTLNANMLRDIETLTLLLDK